MELKQVTVPATKAARFHAFSSAPEDEAFAMLKAWAEGSGVWKRGSLLEPDPTLTVYGYNNPNPAAGSPNYGYEFVVCGPDLPLAPETVEIEGGNYVVTPFTGSDPSRLPEAWQALVREATRAGYRTAGHQWMERHWLPEMKIELFLPVG
jgi:hypothetical protein